MGGAHSRTEGIGSAIGAFAEISPYLTAAHIRTFLFVAEHGSCTQKELEIELGMIKSGASRNVAFWDGNSKIGKSAPEQFLRTDVNPEDRRTRIITVTPAGKSFYKKIKKIVA